MYVERRADIFDPDGKRVAVIDRPAGIHITAPFGAEKAVLEIQFRKGDAWIPVDEGYRVELRLNGILKFEGKISALRTDSVGAILSLVADREPLLDLTEAISQTYENETVTDILGDIIQNLTGSPVTYSDDYPSSTEVDRLELVNTGLFYAVDLLAKLGGNYLWDVSWTNQLRFRPPDAEPDHVLYYHPGRYRFRIWETDRPVKNYLQLYGGVVDENEFRRDFADEESVQRYGLRRDSLFVRPITTEGAYLLLRDAVLAVLPRPANEKNLDIHYGTLDINTGDTIELRETGLPQLDDDNIFRVATLEHWVDADGKLCTRLHLALGLESSTRYQFYIDHDPMEDPSLFISRRVGPFRLDYSALDSSAHLDE
jgi:hypothetical protein